MHPTAFQLGPFTVNWYGLLVAAGFLAGIWTASRRAPLAGLRPELVLDLGPWLILGAIIGARVLYVVSYWQEGFAGHPFVEIFKVWRGGLVFYGGLIGASVAVLTWILAKRLPLWRVADTLAPSIPLGSALGRIGCLMYGCCYGSECHLPWAVTYPAAANGLDLPTGPVHPAPIYDSILSLGLYLGLAWLFRRRRFDGQVFACYLVGYALTRSFSEVFRGDYPHRYLGWATPAQVLSVFILATGLILWRVLGQPKPAPQPK